MPPILEIDDLTKRFGRRLVLDRLSLTVHAGDVFGFLGPNGAGKTTTLRIALGLIRPSAGSVMLFGEDARRSVRARSRVGAMIEIPRFYPYLSAVENLRLLGRLSGLTDESAMRDVLEVVELADVAHDPVGNFSQGMRQRLGVGQALLGDPDLVVLDEPTNGLDPKGIRDVRDLIRRVNAERGTSFVISSHLLHEVEMLCSHVAIVDRGRLIEQGDVDDLLRGEPDHFRISVGDPERARRLLVEAGFFVKDGVVDGAGSSRALHLDEPAARVPDANALLVERGVAVFAIEPDRPSLEEHFLRRIDGERKRTP